jgi:hypothetical protein
LARRNYDGQQTALTDRVSLAPIEPDVPPRVIEEPDHDLGTIGPVDDERMPEGFPRDDVDARQGGIAGSQ